MAENRDVDSVLGETRRVLGHSKRLQPVRDLRHTDTSHALSEASGPRHYITRSIAQVVFVGAAARACSDYGSDIRNGRAREGSRTLRGGSGQRYWPRPERRDAFGGKAT